MQTRFSEEIIVEVQDLLTGSFYWDFKNSAYKRDIIWYDDNILQKLLRNS